MRRRNVRTSLALLISASPWLAGTTSAQDAGTTETPPPQTQSAQTNAAQSSASSTAPTQAPPSAPVSEAAPSELEKLERTFAELMDELVRARARVAVLGKALFRTRVELWLNDRVDDHALTRITLSLDGAPVFTGDGSSAGAAELTRLFEGFATPGLHMLGVSLEQENEADSSYRYLSSQQFTFQVPTNSRTELRIVLDDDSDIAEEFADDREGEYDIRTRIEVVAHELEHD